jgi:type II secretion system protein G
MALIECPECKNMISDRASACPNCGNPISTKFVDSVTWMPEVVTIRRIAKKWKDMQPASSICIAVALMVFGIWFYSAPYLAVRGIKSALITKDAAKLSSYINFPALKGSLRTSFNARVGAEVLEGKEANPFATLGTALGIAMAESLINPMIDELVTPEHLAMMMKPQPGENDNAWAWLTQPDAETRMSMSYESFNRFVVKVKDAGQPIIGFIFTRDGLFSWKLSDANFLPKVEDQEKIEKMARERPRELELRKQKAAKTQIEYFGTALDSFRLSVGRYPTTKEGLKALRTNPGVANWDGPYLRKDVPLDPWGKPYVYTCPGQSGNTPFDIVAPGDRANEDKQDQALDYRVGKSSPKVPTQPVITITDSVLAYYLQNLHSGQVLVIEGEVLNESSRPVSFVMIEGKLFNSKDTVAQIQRCYVGNSFTRKEITNLNLSEMQEKMMNQKGRNLKNVRIPPAGKVPFMLVFHNLPEVSTLSNYGVNVISSKFENEDVGSSGAIRGPKNDESAASNRLVNMYAFQVTQKIQSEWRLRNYQGISGLKAVVEVEIKKTGEIVSIKITKTSGNKRFDDAAVRAINRAAPLPPVPKSIAQSSTKLILTFLPGNVS